MNKQKSLLNNAFYSFLKSFFSLIFPLITFPYASRILTPEGIGRVNFSNSIIYYFLLISGLGIGTYATREVSKLKNDKIQLSKFVKEIFTINIISSFISYTLFIIILLFVPKFYDYKNLLLVSSINIILTTLGIDWFFSGIEDYKYITIRSFLFQIIAIIYLFLFVKDVNDTINYIVFGLISSVGSKVLNIFYVLKFIDFKIKTKIELKKHLKFIFTFFGMSLVTSLYTVLDSTMLGFLTNDVEIGYYTAATKINKLVIGLLSATFGILLPRFTVYLQNNENNKFKELVQNSINIMILLSIPMIFGLTVLSEPLVLLFSGDLYLPAIKSMNIISPIIFSIGIATVTGIHILPSINKEKISFISYIFGAISNFSINILLIPKYGNVGAAIGTLCSETIVMFIQVLYLRRLIFTKETIINLLESLFLSFIMFSILKFFMLLNMNLILKTVSCTVLGILIYLIGLYILKNKTLKYCSSIILSKFTKNNK